MIELDISMDLGVTPLASDSHPIEDELSLVMEELVKLSATDCGIDNPAMSFDAERGIVTIEVTATAKDFDTATATADSCIRTAIHAAGGRTPRWTAEKRSERAQLSAS